MCMYTYMSICLCQGCLELSFLSLWLSKAYKSIPEHNSMLSSERVVTERSCSILSLAWLKFAKLQIGKTFFILSFCFRETLGSI